MTENRHFYSCINRCILHGRVFVMSNSIHFCFILQNGVNKAKKVAKTVANKVVNVAKSMLHCDKTKMSRDVRKPVFGVSDQAPHKPGCTATEDG